MAQENTSAVTISGKLSKVRLLPTLFGAWLLAFVLGAFIAAEHYKLPMLFFIMYMWVALLAWSLTATLRAVFASYIIRCSSVVWGSESRQTEAAAHGGRLVHVQPGPAIQDPSTKLTISALDVVVYDLFHVMYLRGRITPATPVTLYRVPVARHGAGPVGVAGRDQDSSVVLRPKGHSETWRRVSWRQWAKTNTWWKWSQERTGSAGVAFALDKVTTEDLPSVAYDWLQLPATTVVRVTMHGRVFTAPRAVLHHRVGVYIAERCSVV